MLQSSGPRCNVLSACSLTNSKVSPQGPRACQQLARSSAQIKHRRHLWSANRSFTARTCQRPGQCRATVDQRQQSAIPPATIPESKPLWQRFYAQVTGFPFPLGPFFERKTIRYEVDPGSIWTFEQPQSLGGSNVTANVRMTVIKLKSGGLFIYAPIAPTRECIALLKKLNAPVEYIVLPTFAYEHKVFVGPFSRKFPSAKVFVAPRQWSFPLNLPVQFFGIFPKGVLQNDKTDYPWSDELDHKVFTASLGAAPYSEVAFFHRRSRTLLLTDAVVLVPDEPPEVVPREALNDAGTDSFFVRLLYKDDDATQAQKRRAEQRTSTSRRKGDRDAKQRLGWRRMVLQILFFAPANLLDPNDSFDSLSNRLIVSPVVRTLVFQNVATEVYQWVSSIADDWNFRRIIPCHFAAPIAAGPKDLRNAFAFARSMPGAASHKAGFFDLNGLLGKTKDVEFDASDIAALQGLESLLQKAGVVKNTAANKIE